MKNKILCLFFLIGLNNILMSQKIDRGEIIYEIKFNKEKIEKNLEKNRRNRALADKIKKLIKSISDVEAVLKFDNSLSFYQVSPKMKIKNRQKLNLSFLKAGGKKKYYYNAFTKELVTENCHLLGECFNIVNNSIIWEITQESKIIDGQLCYMAIGEEIINNKKSIITAWFNPKIPVSCGPKNYTGLPGLILEVLNKNFVIRVKKMSLNNKVFKIKTLSNKNKKVTQNQFDDLVKKSFPKELFK